MKIGSARVSTTDQNPALQLAALKREGCEKIFTDKASGALRKRPEVEKCLKRLNTGDVLVLWKLDRLGRSLRDLITLLDDLKGQGIRFKSLTASIDTHTPTGRAMWQMIGVLAELERSLIRERTQAGRVAAIKRGVKMGRKPKLSPQQVSHARKLIEGGGKPRAGGAPAQGGAVNTVCHATPLTSCHQGGGESLDATGVLRCSTQAS